MHGFTLRFCHAYVRRKHSCKCFRSCWVGGTYTIDDAYPCIQSVALSASCEGHTRTQSHAALYHAALFSALIVGWWHQRSNHVGLKWVRGDGCIPAFQHLCTLICGSLQSVCVILLLFNCVPTVQYKGVIVVFPSPTQASFILGLDCLQIHEPVMGI